MSSTTEGKHKYSVMLFCESGAEEKKEEEGKLSLSVANTSGAKKEVLYQCPESQTWQLEQSVK